MNPARMYANTAAATASRERLMVMLFERALKHMRTGIAALEGKRTLEAASTLTRASEIVLELAATLDRPRAPELCDQLAAIYEFVSLRLARAAAAGDLTAAREAERAFAPVAEGFGSAVASLPSSGAGDQP